MALEQSTSTAAHWSAEQYGVALSATDSRVALVSEEDSETLGFLIARGSGKEWEIENLVVAKAARRRGLGGHLMDEFLKLARAWRTESIFLEVRESNLPALCLYEKYGFAECGRRPGYYRDPEEDAIIYKLTLT